MLEVSEFPPQAVAACDDVGQSRAVLPLQAFEQREPILGLLQLCRGRLDAVCIPAQEEREILELRLDAVTRLEVRQEFRVERRQLANPPPYRSEARQHRIVALVE